MKKSKNILLNLPEETQAWLADMLLSNVPYHKAKEILGKDTEHAGCPVVFSSLSVFRPFWDEVCTPMVIARQRRLADGAEAVADNAAKLVNKFDAATRSAIQQKAFEILTNPQASALDVSSIVTLALKAKDQDLKQSQLELAREKFEWDAAVRAMEEAVKIKTIAVDGALNSDQKIAAVRKVLFGVNPA